jgi:hypothetical protein
MKPRIVRLLDVAHNLPEQAAAPGEESAGGIGLIPRSVFFQGSRSVQN